MAVLLTPCGSHATDYFPTPNPDIEALLLQYSCENTNVLTNSCCNVVKGRLVLQTQYWDTYTGLEDYGHLLPGGSWTIHGLWPNNLTVSQFDQAMRLRSVAFRSSSWHDGPTGIPTVKTFIEDFNHWDLLKCSK